MNNCCVASLTQVLRRLEVEAGTLILQQGEEVADVYWLETGQAVVQIGAGDETRMLGTLEKEAPEVAIAVHRVLAGMLGDRLMRTIHLAEALQC